MKDINGRMKMNELKEKRNSKQEIKKERKKKV
jgi:hypothetical protein